MILKRASPAVPHASTIDRLPLSLSAWLASCASHIRVRSIFHLVLETPRANLVPRMKWVLGTWANVARRLYCQPRVLPWAGTRQVVGLK